MLIFRCIFYYFCKFTRNTFVFRDYGPKPSILSRTRFFLDNNIDKVKLEYEKPLKLVIYFTNFSKIIFKLPHTIY